MPSLGDFDAARAAHTGEQFTFTLAGREWSVVPDVPAFAVFDLADVQELADADAWTAFRDFLIGIIDPTQRDEFVPALRDAGVGIGTLLQVVKAVMEAVTARPTSPLSS